MARAVCAHRVKVVGRRTIAGLQAIEQVFVLERLCERRLRAKLARVIKLGRLGGADDDDRHAEDARLPLEATRARGAANTLTIGSHALAQSLDVRLPFGRDEASITRAKTGGGSPQTRNIFLSP